MNFLIFSNWGIEEGITHSAVFPLAKALARRPDVFKIVLCTIEQRDFKEAPLKLGKTVHVPLKAKGDSSVAKLADLVRVPFLLRRIARRNAIDLVWCKGAPAGGIGSLVNLLSGIPFVVDSFEPHSDYMRDSGTWSRYGAKYQIQKLMEVLARRRSLMLLPVSQAYLEVLAQSGIDRSKLVHLPCTVDLDQFRFNAEARASVRKKLKLAMESTVGIYVGKFGGLYYDNEAFTLYQALFRSLGQTFFLILITETDHSYVSAKIQAFNLPADRIYIFRVSHSDIADYLSAADFGISTIKSVPAMAFCSPIKHGEYWSSDLPIISTLAFGDDQSIITKEGGGVIVDPVKSDFSARIVHLKEHLGLRNSDRYSKLARKYRNPDFLDRAVELVAGSMVTIKSRGD